MAVTATVVGALALAVAIAALISILLRPKTDPREPPAIHSTIPFFGHIIGMLREGPLYVARVRYVACFLMPPKQQTTNICTSANAKVPIFNMPMLGRSVYICGSPQYAALIQRASSTLDLDVLIANISPRMVGAGKDTARILLEHKTIMKEAHEIINPPLSQQRMDNIATTQLSHFSDFINKIEDSQEVELYRFLTREVTAATMHTFYGPKNPFAVEPDLIDAFWDWEEGLATYMTGFLLDIFASKAKKGIDRCVKGFERYAAAGGYTGASPLIQERSRMHESHGITGSEHARLELGLCFGFNSNASITTFWVIDTIFSQPKLLAEIRKEVEDNAIVAPGVISFPALRDSCSLLSSTYKEVMRITAPMTSARMVLEDTLIDDTYLLRKGSVVQIAGAVMHRDAAIWGADVSSFNPRRFQSNWNGSKTDLNGNLSTAKADQVHPAAFRGFGGGASLCPGRYVAQMEIISLTAALVCGFDMAPPQSMKAVDWTPAYNGKKSNLTALKPARELHVQIKKRKGFENTQWTLQA